MYPLPHIRHVVSFAVALILLCAGSVAAGAQTQTLTAPQANELAQSGELLLVDIRSRDEWRQTGLAAPAHPISMHEAGFLDNLARLRAAHPDRPVALICATGGRSAWLRGELEKRGLGSVIDVSEGMMGNGGRPGWIAGGLPIKPFDG